VGRARCDCLATLRGRRTTENDSIELDSIENDPILLVATLRRGWLRSTLLLRHSAEVNLADFRR
jgi:hypothetical protein